MPFFEGKLLNKTLTIKILKNYVFLGNCLFNISSQKVSLSKKSFMSVFLDKTQVIQKVGPIGQPQ
jgi:hypothetical protein